MSAGVPSHALAFIVLEDRDALGAVLTGVSEPGTGSAIVFRDAVQTNRLGQEVFYQLSILVHLVETKQVRCNLRAFSMTRYYCFVFAVFNSSHPLHTAV